jgi:macrolide transport system ATP-binding/permease protein
MGLFTRLASLTRNLFRRGRTDSDLEAEVRAYADLLADEKIRSGMNPAEAHRKTSIELGGVEQVKENVRDVRAGHLLESLGRDLRFTLRGLRKRPGFTIVVVLSLALGIGANAAIFSLVDAVVFRPMPVPHASAVITIDTAASKLTSYGGSSYLDYLDFCARAKSFQSLALMQEMSSGMNASTSAPNSKPENVSGLLVSDNFFSALEVQPILGRGFLPEEGKVPGRDPVTVISYSLWKRVFDSDPNITGKIVKLNGHSFSVVGVAPKSFSGADLFYRPDIFVPAVMAAEVTADGMDTLKQRSYRGFDIRGRLHPRVTLAQAQAEMNVIMSDLEKEHPESNKDNVAIVRTEMGRRMQLGIVAPPLILSALVILVLLMACANVASLMMARATSRLKEISTQIALGATRATLIRQFLTESAVLAFLGGAAGILLAYGAICGFRTLVPFAGGTSGPEGPDFRLDLRVLACVAIASAISVLLFGLAPAFMAVKDAWSAVMTTRSSASGSRSFSSVARRVLIGGQIALSVVLLVVGGLFLKSFTRAQNIDIGFNPNRLLLVTLDPLLQGYSNDEASRFHEQLSQRVAALPGVKSLSVATRVPFLSGASWDLSIDGYIAPDGEKFLDLTNSQVDPHYFSTLQIPLLQGRDFNANDTRKSPGVAIVNETLARNFIAGPGDLGKALGRIIRLRDGLPLQIVGVTKDSSYGGQIGTPPPAVFYLPYMQQGGPRATLVIRSDVEPSILVPAIRAEIAALDPEITPVSVLKMPDIVSQQGLFFPRIVALLGGAFGFVALSLAAIGLYGVVSFMVGRRTQEIGIRMTLGAQRSAVLRMVLANGLKLAAAGLAIGLAVAMAATPALRSMLVGVSPWDATTFLAIGSVLIAVTAVASWIPASRATHVDPMVALRHE